MAISIGASLSTSLAGIIATTFGDRSAFLGLALAGLCGLLLLLVGMPETARRDRAAISPTAGRVGRCRSHGVRSSVASGLVTRRVRQVGRPESGRLGDRPRARRS